MISSESYFTNQDPATYNLMRRLLAFRKSLSEFEASVTEVMKEVESLLGNDEDLVQLYLTRLLTHFYEYHDMTL